MATQQTFAVVLNVADYGESDKIVTIYSHDHGKQTGIAKGAKRSKKRFVNKLEIFSLLDVQYAENCRSSLVRIDHAELLDPFVKLRQDYGKYAASSLLCELVLHWTKENDSDTELFDLLVWALNSLNEGQPIARTVILFQVKMLGVLGYRPHLEGCMECGRLDAEGVPYRFSTGRSGLVCAACSPTENSADGPVLLSLNTAKLLHKAQDMDRQKLGRLHFSRTSTQEAISFLKRYDRHLLQREIQSWDYLSPDT